MNGVNEEQIKDAIEGDMFKVQEVNIELVLTWIENVMVANGRSITFEKWIPRIIILLDSIVGIWSIGMLVIRFISM